MARALSIDLFAEDNGHAIVITAILKKMLPACEIQSTGINRKLRILKASLQQVACDLLVLVKDANKVGMIKRKKELLELVPDRLQSNVVLCTPEPYIERWLLLDSKAFKAVYGRGCDAPAIDKEGSYYKDALKKAIAAAGVLGSSGFDRAADIINAMDFDTIQDDSFQTFITELKTFLQKEQ